MFIEAHERFSEARQDIDYIVSILLSGAVLGIVTPLLKEQGGHSTHELLARISNTLANPEEESAHEGFFRVIYNSLKHSGNAKKGIPASADLLVEADIRNEAAYMLDAAKEDFRNLEVSTKVLEGLPKRFFELMESDGSYS